MCPERRPAMGWQNAPMTSPTRLDRLPASLPADTAAPSCAPRAEVALPPPAIAFVATSARSLVECARRSDCLSIALDAFTDLDTARLAETCMAVGGDGLRLDRERLLAALAALRGRGDVAGWVAGSGFEAQLDLLAEAAGVLPLLGNDPQTVRRVRTPAAFHAVLDAHGVAHPAFRLDAPADPRGWLVKDAHACGGWHVRRAAGVMRGGDTLPPSPGRYFQRELAGEVLSCLFLAARGSATVVGHSRQIVRALGGRPFVYRGGVGPLVLPPAVEAVLAGIADRLTDAFGLVGLNGIDYLLDGGGQPWVLELNPRPTAAIQLFADAFAGGLVRAHLDACAGRALPARLPPAPGVRGFETVFARKPGHAGEAAVAWLLAHDGCRDIPQPGMQHAWGDPLCTVIAEAATEADVRAELAARRLAVRRVIESAVEPACP